MTKEAYVIYEVAKLLKEKGFDECIFEFYEGDRIKYARNDEGFRLSELPDTYYPHITHQMAMRWLREVHNIDIIIFHEKLPNDCYWARIERDLSTEFEQEPEYNSYEDAVEAALKYSLENLI